MEEKQQQGIHWRYREVARANAPTVLLVVELVLLLAGAIIYFTIASDEKITMSAIANAILSVKAQEMANTLAWIITLTLPALVVIMPLVFLILWVVLNLRDRKKPRTPEALEQHKLDAAFVWTWPLSFVLGILDFNIAFVALEILRDMIAQWGNFNTQLWSTVLITVIALVFAERRIMRVSRSMVAKHWATAHVIGEVLDGKRNGELLSPNPSHQYLLLVATVLSLGIVRTPRWASRLVEGSSMRSRVKMFSGFLASTIHGITAAFSFGLTSLLVNAISDTNGQLATGRGDQLEQRLRQPSPVRAHWWIEVVAVLGNISLFVLAMLEMLA